ncbi:hypothetical protein CUTA107171_02765 [Cupriavidus taiwanensis]
MGMGMGMGVIMPMTGAMWPVVPGGVIVRKSVFR